MIQEKVNEGGLVRIPESVMKKLSLQDGDKVIFTEDSKGNIIMANSSLDILPTLECGFWGRGAQVGITDEQSIVSFVRVFRKGEEQ